MFLLLVDYTHQSRCTVSEISICTYTHSHESENPAFSACICSAVEVAVVGPPDLYRLNVQTAAPLTMMTLAWVRSENDLTHLLPICFAVNTMRFVHLCDSQELPELCCRCV